MEEHTKTHNWIFQGTKGRAHQRLYRLLFGYLLLGPAAALPAAATGLGMQPTAVEAGLQAYHSSEQTALGLPQHLFPAEGVAAEKAAVAKAPLQLLGESIDPGTKKRLSWSLGYTFEGMPVSAPVLAVNGSKAGPTLCLTAAVHGDEINGIAMVHRTIAALEPEQLNGTVIGVPIVNLHGYRRSSRYLPDRRDLNRHFPGSPNGSAADRIAHSFFQQVISHCNALVDLHTGSFHRTNLPQVRADLSHPKVLELAYGFEGVAVVHSKGAPGTLRRAATERGIPSITLEAGEPHRLQLRDVDQGLKGIKSLMKKLSMLEGTGATPNPETVFHQTKWIRTDRAGILLSQVQLGDPIKAGQQLGIISDPVTNQETAIISPYNGQILGMALNQVTIPGYAAYHIGIDAGKPGVSEEVSEHVASKPRPSGYSDGEE